MGQSQKGCRVGAAAAVGGYVLGIECKNRCTTKANIIKYKVSAGRHGTVKKYCRTCGVAMMHRGLFCFCCNMRLSKKIRGSAKYTGVRY